jgi:hypothetical protein
MTNKDKSLWDKLTPNPTFKREADTANLTDKEAEQWRKDLLDTVARTSI